LALANLVVIIKDGVIEHSAHPREIVETPNIGFVANSIGAHNLLQLAVLRVNFRCEFIK
jgi:ABC-type Fe3+/spermidine/putrescine transport system ATPase subunit